MHDHGQIYSGIEGASPGRFAALVTKHEVVTLGKLGEERAQALGRAPVAAMSGFQIAHDCPERVVSVLSGHRNKLDPVPRFILSGAPIIKWLDAKRLTICHFLWGLFLPTSF